MTHRDLCILVSRWFLSQPWCRLIGWELRYNRGYADAIGMSLKDKDPGARICIAEVKRTRADLLQDLKAQKLLKYQQGTTHCYLAATPEALRLHKLTHHECIEELTKLGLPKEWGILVIDEAVTSIRSARQINKYNPLRARALIKKIARSHMYRMLNDSGDTLPDLEEEY